MKDIPVKPGRRYIASLVAEGEHSRQDFKFSISDARKIARSLSAFANAGGGRLLIGVKDNGAIAGVRNEEDVYVVELAASRYCDPPQEVSFAAYSIDTGIVVIVATVEAAPVRPVRVVEQDGTLRAYYRVADENVVAHPLMVRAWGGTPVMFSLGSEAAGLLALVADSTEGIVPARVAPALGMSRRRADSLIVALASAGRIDFRYNGREFVLVPATES